MAKKTRKHLPALTPEKLKLLSQQIDANKRISKSGKRAVKASLQAAQNDNAESPDVIIASLPKERRETVVQHTADYILFSQGITARGKAALQGLSNDEWNELVNGNPGTNPGE